MEPKPNRNSGKKSWAFSSLLKTYDRFVKIRGNPREIALGFALGLFVGMSPTLGIQMAIAIFIAALFKWNKISAAIGVWISNPLTAPFLYSLTYFAGAKLLGVNNTINSSGTIGDTPFYTMLLKAPEILWAATLGGIVLGLPVAVSGYFFAYTAVSRYQEDIKRKLAERKARKALKKKAKKEKAAAKREKHAAIDSF